MIQTITKSLGILALILTFTLSTSAQSKKIKTYQLPDKDDICAGGLTNLIYYSSYDELSIRVLEADNASCSWLDFRSVTIAQIAGSGAGKSKSLPRRHYVGGKYRINPKRFGFSGLCHLIVAEKNGKVHRLSFYVN